MVFCANKCLLCCWHWPGFVFNTNRHKHTHNSSRLVSWSICDCFKSFQVCVLRALCWTAVLNRLFFPQTAPLNACTHFLRHTRTSVMSVYLVDYWHQKFHSTSFLTVLAWYGSVSLSRVVAKLIFLNSQSEMCVYLSCWVGISDPIRPECEWISSV